MRVLVVEDDRHIAGNIQQIIRLGFSDAVSALSVVSTVEAAKMALKSVQPDILLFDISLPDGNGFEILSALPLASETLLLCMTGLAANNIIHDLVRHRIFKYIPKPFESTTFHDILSEALEAACQKRQRAILEATGEELFRRVHEENEMLKRQLLQAEKVSNWNATDDENEFIEIDTGSTRITVGVNDIFMIEVKGNYVDIHTISRSTVLMERNTLAYYESRLQDYGFVKLNKSALVQMASILDVCNETVVLPKGKTIEIAQRRKKAFEEAVKYRSSQKNIVRPNVLAEPNRT